MGKIKPSVFDAGPFIHLSEIDILNHLTIFQSIFVTEEVLEECKQIREKIQQQKNIVIKELFAVNKDFAKYLIERYNLHLGESTGIALCKQEKISLFFTDDLEARETAILLGFEAHGTLAIILRSLREKIITKHEAKEIIEKLYQKSTLFFTRDLKEWTIKEIEKYNH